ncbi:transglycosylase SLT domain-containing protein [Acidisoma cellulosilytica]|uniref:Transglycosylase SLT domain-containing protein n=1 Tax=Acidisoma cellulosilyticum TaxID=2802395 RepID=A0A964E595_9PROT|nr:transglycosylase SLT domain-containing protein [Acidisoma cellulosilyticum]MCB8881748.1 transglycosylase SLT domain-containing protein [Acidisoma cellulosilyticum]
MTRRSLKFLSVLAASAGVSLAAPCAVSTAQAGLLDRQEDASQVCGDAVQAAEAQYTLPAGLLFAISEVESGRPVGNGSTRRPWPWTVQADNQSHFFATKAAAIGWVEQAQAQGITSIDVGCMQINLMYHPNAFRTIADAFDPTHNANYAARFLISLHEQTGDWTEAAGRYHSQTLALALPYRQRVEAMLSGKAAALSPQDRRLLELQTAWNATLGGGGNAPSQPDLSGNWGGLAVPPKASLAKRHLGTRPIMLSDAH